MLMGEDIQAHTRGESWPYTTLVMCPGVPRNGSVPTSRYHHGIRARWCVWSIGMGGRMSVSEARGYDLAGNKQMRPPQ